MFKRAIGGVLCVVLGAMPAYAQDTVQDITRLVRVLAVIGVSVHYDSKACKEHKVYGAYFASERTLHVCKRGDNAEQLDTLRHEAWHVAQNYADCKVGSDRYRPLARHTEINRQYWERAEVYPERLRHMEADAYQAAHLLSTRQIAELLILKYTACNR